MVSAVCSGILGYTNIGGGGCVAGLAYSGGVFYGVDTGGGTNGAGVVFSLSLGGTTPPPTLLNIQFSSGAVVLTWSNSSVVLQASSNLTGGFTTVPGAANPYTVTPTNAQQFFRLQTN